LHWRRLWARRFNQSAMLAAAISRETGLPVAAGALKRVKPTVQQFGLSRTERAGQCPGRISRTAAALARCCARGPPM
jgi:predicted amidophosphoribosyltransferase